MVYLVITYDYGVRNVDRVIKGLCASAVMIACLGMTVSSGASMNPAFAFAQGLYMLALDNSGGHEIGMDEGIYLWVYCCMPFFGSLFAALLYMLHSYHEV
jgi:glycerol uptake facilitator-like aquaporin